MINIHHLETDVTTACQLSCVGCNHHVPLYRAHGIKTATVEGVAHDLEHLGRVLHADIWGALGGEPLLHHKLIDILRVVRESRIADTIEVWTNGLLLPRMRREFWQSFDRLVVSVYPGKHDEQSLSWIADKCMAHSVELRIIDERAQPNFKTLLEPVPTDRQATIDKFRGCFFRHFSRVVNDGYFFTCCCAPHMPSLVQGRNFGDDGIPVKNVTEDQINAYLTRAEPLGACYSCAGRDTAKQLTWHEQKDPALWLKESAGVQ